MKAKTLVLLSTFTLCCTANSCFSQNTALLEFTAEYEASANGLAATATRSLRRIDESSYRLNNSLEASLAGQTLASLEQASEFAVQGTQLLPINYTYQLSGVSRASHAIFFNWDAAIAISTEDDESWQLDLHAGVMDQLSYQVAIRQALLDGSTSESDFSFDIVDGDDIEAHEYRIIGEESLSTPLGQLNTLKLERVRGTADERLTEIWLAVNWDYLLTRIEQRSSSGFRIVLELESAEIDGNNVRADN